MMHCSWIFSLAQQWYSCIYIALMPLKLEVSIAFPHSFCFQGSRANLGMLRTHIWGLEMLQVKADRMNHHLPASWRMGRDLTTNLLSPSSSPILTRSCDTQEQKGWFRWTGELTPTAWIWKQMLIKGKNIPKKNVQSAKLFKGKFQIGLQHLTERRIDCCFQLNLWISVKLWQLRYKQHSSTK